MEYSIQNLMRSKNVYKRLLHVIQNPLRMITNSEYYETNYSKSSAEYGIVRFLMFEEFMLNFREKVTNDEYWKLYAIYNQNVMGLDII